MFKTWRNAAQVLRAAIIPPVSDFVVCVSSVRRAENKERQGTGNAGFATHLTSWVRPDRRCLSSPYTGNNTARTTRLHRAAFSRPYASSLERCASQGSALRPSCLLACGRVSGILIRQLLSRVSARRQTNLSRPSFPALCPRCTPSAHSLPEQWALVSALEEWLPTTAGHVDVEETTHRHWRSGRSMKASVADVFRGGLRV